MKAKSFFVRSFLASIFLLLISSGCHNSTTGCHLTISPDHQSFGANGGSGQMNVSEEGQDCTWVTESDVTGWAHITLGSGSGSGSILFTVDPNPSPLQRGGSIFAEGKDNVAVFAVHQDGMTLH